MTDANACELWSIQCASSITMTIGWRALPRRIIRRSSSIVRSAFSRASPTRHTGTAALTDDYAPTDALLLLYG